MAIVTSTTHTNNRNTGKYKTLVVILGVLVALVIGYSVSANSLDIVEIHPNLNQESSIVAIFNGLKMGASYIFQFIF